MGCCGSFREFDLLISGLLLLAGRLVLALGKAGLITESGDDASRLATCRLTSELEVSRSQSPQKAASHRNPSTTTRKKREPTTRAGGIMNCSRGIIHHSNAMRTLVHRRPPLDAAIYCHPKTSRCHVIGILLHRTAPHRIAIRGSPPSPPLSLPPRAMQIKSRLPRKVDLARHEPAIGRLLARAAALAALAARARRARRPRVLRRGPVACAFASGAGSCTSQY